MENQAPNTPSAITGLTRQLFNYVSGTQDKFTDIEGQKLPTNVNEPEPNRRNSFVDLATGAVSSAIKQVVGKSQTRTQDPELASFDSLAVQMSPASAPMRMPVSSPIVPPRSESMGSLHQMAAGISTSTSDPSLPSVVSAMTLNKYDQEEAAKAVETTDSRAPLTSIASEASLTETEIIDDGEIIIQLHRSRAQVQPRVEPTLSAEPQPLFAAPVAETSEPAVVVEQPKETESIPIIEPEEPALAAPTSHVIAEFDPLIPADWMIKFDSPASKSHPNLGHSAPLIPVTPAKGSVDSMQPKTPFNLLDASMHEIVSPMSMPKYSERELENIKSQVRQQATTEVQIIETEISNLESRLRKSEQERAQMKTIVDEYEKTMQKMIDESRQEKQRFKMTLEKVTEEKQRAVKELAAVEASLKDLRIRHEEMRQGVEQSRQNESVFLSTIERLKADVQASETRVEAIGQHAQGKLDEANTEIAKIKQANEKELDLMKAKLQKSELQIKTLENTIKQKQSENSELMAICDDLIKKMESQNADK